MLRTAPSTVIGGRYELQRELARGGMGSVWEAKDRKLRRQVAIKVMVPMWANAAEATSRFEREAMAVAQLQSPHVVQIFDYGVEQGCPYIVMELLEGEDLRSRLQRRERLDLETAGRIMVQTAKALSAAHAVGIIHRDLKPGNIYLVKSAGEEIVKVLDFGVAKVDTTDDEGAEERTKAGTLLGTPQYMSPEQARGLPNIDHRADLWSLAVIMYRALVGRLPYTGKSAADVIVRICTRPAIRPSSLAPDLSPEVDRFFARALARELDQRFSSARQMAVAFSRIAPASFPSLSMPEPMVDIADARRHRQAASADLDWDSREEPVAPTRRPPRPARLPPPSRGRLVPILPGTRAAPSSATPLPPPAGAAAIAAPGPATRDAPAVVSSTEGASDTACSRPDGAPRDGGPRTDRGGAVPPMPAPGAARPTSVHPALAEAPRSEGAPLASDPIGQLPGGEPTPLPAAPLTDSSGSLSVDSSLRALMVAPPSGGTLASGLVDTPPARPAGRKRGLRWIAAATALALGGALALGFTTVLPWGAEPSAGAGSTEADAAASTAAAATSSVTRAPSTTGTADAPTSAPSAPLSSATEAGGGGAPQAASSATSAPTATTARPAPRRVRPAPRPRPKPTAATPEPDPFSERL